MEKKITQMIDEAIRCLNWDVIMEYYREHDYYEIGAGKKIKRIPKVPRTDKLTKDFLVKDLKHILNFVINNNIQEFDHDQWFILFKNYKMETKDGLGTKLELLFAPTRGVAFEEEFKEVVEIDPNVQEKEALEELLSKSVHEENYELSAVLRDQIKKVTKLIKFKK